MKKIKKELYHFINGNKVIGANPNMIGDCTGLEGNCTWLRGDCSGLYGDCTGLRGNLDACDITNEERKQGIDINDLTSAE